MEKEIKGLFLLLLAETFWGASATFAKFVYGVTSQLDPFVFVQIKFAMGAIILSSIFYFKDRESLRIQRRDLPYFIKYGCCIFLMQWLIYYAISQTNVGIAVFLQSFSAVLVSIYSIVITHEKVGSLRMMALGVGFLGLFVMLYNELFLLPSVKVWGILSGLLSAIAVTVFIIYGKYGLSKYKPQTMLIFPYIFGVSLSSLVVPPWVAFSKGFNVIEWGYFFILAIFSAVIPYYFNLKGLDFSTPSVAGIVTILNPVVAGITAYIFIGEVLTPVQIMGIILISVGILFLQLDVQQGVKKEAQLFKNS